MRKKFNINSSTTTLRFKKLAEKIRQK